MSLQDSRLIFEAYAQSRIPDEADEAGWKEHRDKAIKASMAEQEDEEHCGCSIDCDEHCKCQCHGAHEQADETHDGPAIEPTSIKHAVADLESATSGAALYHKLHELNQDPVHSAKVISYIAQHNPPLFHRLNAIAKQNKK